MSYKVYFFEIEKAWEKQLYLKKLKEKLQDLFEEMDITFTNDFLDENTCQNYQDVDIAVIQIKSHVTENVINQLPNLKFLITRTTGTDHIDILACQKKGVIIANCSHYASTTVAEYTIALVFALAKKLKPAIEKSKVLDFSKEGLLGIDLIDKTIGIVGTGRIGSEVARIAHGIGMEILAYDISPSQELAKKYNVNYVDLDTLLKRSDVITILIPYYPKTHHLINKDNIRLVKDDAIFINTARGPIVDTEALIWALRNNKLQGGIALDVFEGEKVLLEISNSLNKTFTLEEYEKALKVLYLLKFPNTIFTPHVAFYTKDAIERVIDWVVDNIYQFLTYKTLPNKYRFYF
ncbi:NAD(P)-dependent oxidoreductase [Thermodesulfobacterium hydrogeniphilum]|uniref:NAD(P)-dependent oxidoreductase n=1 Tax=Thermodesulfobacterium hydrogeniphilum TaxID=161156 RepID=UPI00068D7A71|nr:NAD(P)-dependent oxidoreductase [Thermodesulfobacterium hydrogeniphilum]